ncbi:AIR carboxylase family protein [Candidatus Woesearchaeota archaeon]|nr:AIR carboxylase family protein [Candidatus Woesearchaeota archaeon]
MDRYKSLFFAGAEVHQSREEILRWRTTYGEAFTHLGFHVLDPTLGKDIESIPLDELIAQDLALIDQSHILVAYLPRSSDGSLREIRRAKENKILVYAFTDKGNPLSQEARQYIDAWFTDFSELRRVLGTFLSPPGEYFTTAHTNNVQGTVVLYGSDIHEVAPHYLHRLLSDIEGKVNVYYFCAEKSHIHELAQKLPTMLRLGKVKALSVLTKDGSPHDVQLHTVAEEVAENLNFQGDLRHYVVERGEMYTISGRAVRKSRHLSEIEKTLENEVHQTRVAIILGSRKDESMVVDSGLLQLFDTVGITYEYSIISSDRNPEALRDYCKGLDDVRVIITVAGLVPNLPLAVKSWRPEIPVISVPLPGEGYEPRDILLASASTPGERPLILSGIGKQGLEKAGYLVLEMFGIHEERLRQRYNELQSVEEPEIKTRPENC